MVLMIEAASMNTVVLHLKHSPELAVTSHGWPRLRPFELEDDRLLWIADLPDSGPRRIEITWEQREVFARIGGPRVTSRDMDIIRRRVGWMFRENEDFEPFWRASEGHAVLGRCAELGAGALIRSATVFEDVVKTLCTTNCHWRNTKRMVARICEVFGKPCIGGSSFTFPTPERVASASVGELKGVGLGYRAEFVRGFACRVIEGDLDVESWVGRDPYDLRRELLKIPGIGPYSANHMLMLLGYYGFIPCDSEVRSYLGLPADTSGPGIDRAAHERYAAWGDYAFLAYKFERVLRNRNYVDDLQPAC